MILVVLLALLGLLVGSFLNVVIYRVPAGESIVRPPSHCRGCGAAVARRDNVPVLSWLVLHGRARCCGAPIGIRYPLVEIATGLSFGAVTAWIGRQIWTSSWPLPGGLESAAGGLTLVAMLFLAAASIALALIDIDTFRLPAVIVIMSWWVGGALLCGAALAAHAPAVAVRTVAGGLVLWLVYRLLHAIYPAGMGYGDVRLAGLLGGYLAFIDWQVLLVGAFAGFLVGGVFGLLLVIVRRGGLRTTIPYGPYMLVGAWSGLLAGQPVMAGYLRLTGIS